MKKGARRVKMARFKWTLRTSGVVISAALGIGLIIVAARIAAVHGIYSIARYVDVNSGDELKVTRLLGFRVKASTEPTGFSRLVRILLKDQPPSDWRFMSSETFYISGRELADGDLSGLASDLDLAARLLELRGGADMSKRTVVESLLLDAHRQDKKAIRDCLDELMSDVEKGAATQGSSGGS